MPEEYETLTVQQALDRGAQLYNAGHLPEAENIYRHILKADPNQDMALAMLGFIAHSAGKHEMALDMLSRAIAINPRNADAHNNLGIVLNACGKAHDAATSYRRALAINPELAETHVNLGLAECRLGRVNDGIVEFGKALAIRPDFFDARVNLGVALCSVGKFEDAVVHYRKALAIQPHNTLAFMNLGDALRGLGRLDEAVDAYQAVIDLSPRDANAHNELGNALRSLGRPEEAVASYRKALAANPDFAMARRNEGSTLQELGRLDEAIESHEKADTALSRAGVLECIYARFEKDRFYRELQRIAAEDATNIGVAAISAFASNQFDCADPYPFCNNPLDFISTKNLISTKRVNSEFLNAIRKQIFESELSGGNQSLLHAGFQSAPTLFVDPCGPIAELQALLREEVAGYFSRHAGSDCLFIREWPRNYDMTAWYVQMEQGGHLTLHNHPAGWLSGVIYLELPPREGDEASIEFGLHGNNLPILNQDYPKKTCRVFEGDLIMFPSSLFHRTLPFRSEESRLCVAFDVNPGMTEGT